MAEAVKIAFQRRVVVLPLPEIMPLRRIPVSLKQMLKYKRIVASISEVAGDDLHQLNCHAFHHPVPNAVAVLPEQPRGRIPR